MSDPVVIPPRGGEIIGDEHDRRVEILAETDSLHATWSRFGPGREGADLHVHRRHTDSFYVLEGELTLRLGPAGDALAVSAGTLVRVPPLVVHGFRNGTGHALSYLNFHAPGQEFAAYLRSLRDGRPIAYDQEPPPSDGGRPPSEAAIGGTGIVVERAGARMELLADDPAVAVAELRADPGADPVPPHAHPGHAEALYVLGGEPSLRLGDREVTVLPGTWIGVPPGLVHSVAFPGPDPVRLLEIHAPGCGFGGFVRALATPGGRALDVAATGFDREPAAGGLDGIW